MRKRSVFTAVAAGLLIAGCGGDPAALPSRVDNHHSPVAAATATASGAPTRQEGKDVALRTGERFVEVRMDAAYTPKAPSGDGTDDYRCFLVDPDVAKDAVITGTHFLPANAKLVHHVILYKVEPQDLAKAKEKDASEPGDGWTCFGGTGIGGGGASLNLDEAPWLGAWAPGAGERVAGDGIGTRLPKGSQIVMQIHYNLRAGQGQDRSAARLRLATDDGSYNYLKTMLLPAPVELPCRPGKVGVLCERDAAMRDLVARFGAEAKVADLLHLLCGADPIGPTQKCTRPVNGSITVRATSGHMHLLGRKISIVANAGAADERTLLDVTNWDFDNQSATVLPRPVTLTSSDTLTVKCTHDQSLRDRLPALAGVPERYVAWGEGTTDEMCLGIVMFTKS